MKKSISLIIAGLFIFICLSAQYYKPVTVEAGRKLKEYFPPEDIYLYPQFTDGKVILKNGSVNPAKLNYNLLLGEMEFLKEKDTLVIARKKDITLITLDRDTFIYNNGYLQIIHSGKFKVFLRDKIKLKDIIKKGAMGTPNRTSAVESYHSIPMDGNLYDLVSPDDMVFQRMNDYYIVGTSDELIEFRKKNVLMMFPYKQPEIQKYLKTTKVNFDKKDDLLKFADFLESL